MNSPDVTFSLGDGVHDYAVAMRLSDKQAPSECMKQKSAEFKAVGCEIYVPVEAMTIPRT